MYIAQIILDALWLLLLSQVVSAAPTYLEPVLTPPNQWIGDGGGELSMSPDAIATFTFNTSGHDWDTLAIDAYGYTYNLNGIAFAPFLITIDGTSFPFNAPVSRPVTFPINTNHLYQVVVSAEQGSRGLFLNYAAVSGALEDTSTSSEQPPPSSTSTSTSTTPWISDPPHTIPPPVFVTQTTTTSQEISSSAPSVSVTVVHVTNLIESQVSTSTSMRPLDNPLIYPPQTSVSLTNSIPEFTADANIASDEPQSYSTIVGTVFGTFAGVCLLAVLAYLWYRRRQKKRIPPSMAYMNYRSTTEQPPRFNFYQHRPVLSPEPQPMQNRAGVGAGLFAAGKEKRALSVLDEKSMEGSMAYSPSPNPLTTSENVTATVVNDRYPSLDSTIDVGIARTLSPPASAEPGVQSFLVAQPTALLERNGNPYDEMEAYGGIEKERPLNPFDDRMVRHAT